MVREVVTINTNPNILRTTSNKCSVITRELITDMIETCHANKGVGLALPQIGINERMFIVCEPNEPVKVFINPVVTFIGNELVDSEEGCLSVPNRKETIQRYKKISVCYTDSEGFPTEKEFEGMTAIIIQHEMDHLIGILYTDHLQPKRCPTCNKAHTEKDSFCSKECFIIKRNKQKLERKLNV